MELSTKEDYARAHKERPIPEHAIAIMRCLVKEHGSPSHAIAHLLEVNAKQAQDLSDAAVIILDLERRLRAAREDR